MFEGVLKTVLNSTLGKFLQIDDIKIGLSGVFELRNVELNAKTIETFLPVSLKLGRVGHLKIELSWLSLLSTPVKVTVSDVYCVAALPQDKDVNIEELAQKMIQQKLETLLNWELLNFPEKEVESDKGTLMKTVDTIIDHITVSVERIHIVFEEPGINAGVTIGSCRVYPVDENDVQLTKCADSSVVGRRKITVSDVGIYLNIDPTEAARGAAQHQYERDERQGNVQALTRGLYGTSTGATSLEEYNKRKGTKDSSLALIDQISAYAPEHSKVGFPPVTYGYCESVWDTMDDPKWSWILVPFSVTVHFNMWKGTFEKLQAMTPPRPPMEANVEIGKIELAINRNQYQSVLTLLAQFVNNPSTLAAIKLQMSQDTSDIQSKDKSLLDLAQKNELLNDGTEYSQLYKRNFQGYPILEEKDSKALLEFEKKHNLLQILQWRAIALKIVQIEYEQDEKPYWRQKAAGGFLTSWFGSNAAPPKPKTTIDPALLRSFIEDPVALQHDEEAKTMRNVKANFVTIYAGVKIAAVAFSLVKPTREKILEFGIYDINTQARLRPHGMGIYADIDRLEAIDHLTQSALSNKFIQKSAGQLHKKFLTASVSMGDKHINPDTGYDMVLQTEVCGVDVLVNLPLLLSLATFFQPPKHAELASRAKNDLMGGFSQLKNTNAMSVFDNRGRQFMDVKVHAPTIIIPTSVSDPNAHVLVTKLGTLAISAIPPSLNEVKEQKILMEKVSKDSKVLKTLTKSQEKRMFYDTFNISLTNVSVSIGDPKLTHNPDDSIYIVRPMQLDLGVSLCLVQQSSASQKKDDKKSNDKKSNDQNENTLIVSHNFDLVLPQMLIDVSLPTVDVQISPLKISRLLRLTKSLLSTLKLTQKATEESSTIIKIEEVVDSDFYAKKTISDPSTADTSSNHSNVNPESTSMLVSCQLGRVSLAIVNDLVPIFPVNILFMSIEGLYCAVAMRSLDMDVSMVLKSFYVQDCLNHYGGPNRFLVAGASRPLLDFGSNTDNKRMMHDMLTHAYPYQDQLPADGSAMSKKRGIGTRNANVNAGGNNNGKTDPKNDLLQAALSTRTSHIDSAFLSCHVSLPQITSPVYAFVSTLATAHFGQVVVSVNRESIPALACFFAKQLLPNPSILTPEDKQFGKIGLDFMTDIEWGDLDEDLKDEMELQKKLNGQSGDEIDQNNQNVDNIENNDGFIQQTQELNQFGSKSQQSPISPPHNIPISTTQTLTDFDPNLFKSGLEIAAEKTQNYGNDALLQVPVLNSNLNDYKNTGFDINRVMPLINAPPVALPQSRPQILFKKPEKDTSTTSFLQTDESKLLTVVKDFLDTLTDIDDHDFNLHYFGLIPGVTAAYPSNMAGKIDFLKLMALYDQDESELPIAEGEDPLVARQTFRNEQTRLRNQILRSELTNLSTILAKYQKHLDFVAGLNKKIVNKYGKNVNHSSLSHFQELSSSSPINCSSSELLTLHRYINTKTLIRFGRLQDRDRVLKEKSGSFEEKVETTSRLEQFKSLLLFRRTQLLTLRQYERKIRTLRRLGCVSSLLCADPVKNNQFGPDVDVNKDGGEDGGEDDDSSNDEIKTDHTAEMQYRVGVFCMPQSYQGDSTSLESALSKTELELDIELLKKLGIYQEYQNFVQKSNKSNKNNKNKNCSIVEYLLQKDSLYDPDSTDVVSPLFPSRYLKTSALEFQQKYSLVPLDVLARVTFGGIKFNLTTKNIPVLQFEISPFKLGFGMHSHGMSVKLLIGTLSLRQPQEGALFGGSPSNGLQNGDITRSFLNQTVEHQLTRQYNQSILKAYHYSTERSKLRKDEPNNGKMITTNDIDALNHLLTTQMVNIKQYIESNYRVATNNQNYTGLYAPRVTQNSVLMQKYTHFVENRRNYVVSYPDIVYTAPNSLKLPQLRGDRPIDEVTLTETHKSIHHMLNLSVEMHNPEMIIFDDTDEFDYYSLAPIHNITGLGDVAIGLQGQGDIDAFFGSGDHDLFSSDHFGTVAGSLGVSGSQHSGYKLQGQRVVDSQKNNKHVNRNSSLLQALNHRTKRNSTTMNTLTAIHKAGIDNQKEQQVVNTAVVTELPFNVPAFILTTSPPDDDIINGQESVLDQLEQNKARIVPTMRVSGVFSGIRTIVCYRSIDTLLKYIEGLDKCMAAVMSNNSYTNTMTLTKNKIKSDGASLRAASLLSHITDVESRLSTSLDDDDDDVGDDVGDEEHNREESAINQSARQSKSKSKSKLSRLEAPISPHGAINNGDKKGSRRGSRLYDKFGADIEQHTGEVDNSAIVLTKRAHVGPAPGDQFNTSPMMQIKTTAQPDFDKQQSIDDKRGDKAAAQKLQKKLTEIGQAVNNLNNATDPETPRLCPLLMDINIVIKDLALMIPISSSSFEMISLTLDKLSITSSTSLVRDLSLSAPAEGATFFAASNETNTAKNTTSTSLLTNLIKQQHQFQRQSSLSKHSLSSTASGSTPGSLARGGSLLGRENSISTNNDSVFRRIRASSVLDDDDEFFDAEELDDDNELAMVLDNDKFTLPSSLLTPQTYFAVPTIPTDNNVFIQFAEHKENARGDMIRTLGKPTQAYEYRNVQIAFDLNLTGIALTTLILIDGRGVREQSAAPRFNSVIDGIGEATDADKSGPTSPTTAAVTSSASSSSLDKYRLQMLDMVSIGDISINATHFTYSPFIIIHPAVRPDPHQTPQKDESDAAMAHTAHTFYPRMQLPDWAVSVRLDNLDLLISQPQLSLLLSLISNHTIFPGNLSEKTTLTVPQYQPATPSNSTTPISLAQIQHYHPAARLLTIKQLKAALQLLEKADSKDSLQSMSSDQAQVVLQSLQKVSVGAKLGGASTKAAASSLFSKKDNMSKVNSRLSRIGTHMGQSRISLESLEEIDVWAKQTEENNSENKQPEKKQKGLGVSVEFEIGRVSVQIIANPALEIAESLCILISTKTRLNMLPDGTIALTCTVDDMTIVNAELPTRNPSLLKHAIFALPIDKAIIKPFSIVTAVSLTPNTFNHKELLAPLPKLYAPESWLRNNRIKTKNKHGTKNMNPFFQPTRQPGQVSPQVINVNCVMTDVDIKISYTDYEMLMAILGTLSTSQSDDFASLGPSKAQPSASVEQDSFSGDQFGTSDIPAAESTHVVEAPVAPTTPVVDYSHLLHSMGDMSVTFTLPNCDILLVNDSPGFPLPFMRINVANITTHVNGFAHRRDILLKSDVKIDFHNGALVAWEPLLEPSSYQITVLQSVTHPMVIKVDSLGKINLNVTRAMMEGLAQSLQLLSTAQAAQEKKLQLKLSRMNNGDEGIQDNDDDDDDDDDDVVVEEIENASQIDFKPEVSRLGTTGMRSSGVLVNYSKRRLLQNRQQFETKVVQNSLKQRAHDSKKQFSFFRLDNHTEFPMYYQFGAYLAGDELNNGDSDNNNNNNNNHNANNNILLPQNLIDIEEVKNDVLGNLLDISNKYYDSNEILSKTAKDLCHDIIRIQHGGYLPSSPQYKLFTQQYNEAIAKLRELTGGMRPKSKLDMIDEDNDKDATKFAKNDSNNLTKEQQRRLFKFNLYYTAYLAKLGNDEILSSLFSIADISEEASTYNNEHTLHSRSSAPLFFNSNHAKIDHVRTKSEKLKATDSDLYHHKSSNRGTIGGLLREQHKQALDMLYHQSTSSKAQIVSQMTDRSHRGASQHEKGHKVNVNSLSLKKQAETAAKKLLSIQIDGYEPIHNIQVETVGFSSHMLIPGKQISKLQSHIDRSDDGSESNSRSLEPLSVLIHVTVVQGIKVVSVRNAKAMVNLTDVVFELRFGAGLHENTLVFPGETFYLPLSTQKYLGEFSDDGSKEFHKFDVINNFKTNGSFVSLRPVTLVSPNKTTTGSMHNLNSRSRGRYMLKTTQNNDFGKHSYSSYRYSYPISIDSLTNGSYLVSEAHLDPHTDNYKQIVQESGSNGSKLPGQDHILKQSNKNADFVTIIQRWRANGLTYWALCPPFSVTNLLSERALISLSTTPPVDNLLEKPRKKSHKNVPQASSSPIGKVNFGCDIVANVAPTHSLRCYTAAPGSARNNHSMWVQNALKGAGFESSVNHVQEYNNHINSSIGFDEFSAQPDPQQALYMSVSIPSLGLMTKTPQIVSKSVSNNVPTHHLYFDLVNARAYQNGLENKKYSKDLRTLTIHCELTQSYFLMNPKTTSAISLPNVVTAVNNYTDSWRAQSESSLLSYSTHELEHSSATSLHNIPSATSAAMKLVLYTPYWLFDTTHLGLLVSEHGKLNDLKHVSPTQYDSAHNCHNFGENITDLFAKMRTFGALNEKSTAQTLLEENSKLVAIGTKMSGHKYYESTRYGDNFGLRSGGDPSHRLDAPRETIAIAADAASGSIRVLDPKSNPNTTPQLDLDLPHGMDMNTSTALLPQEEIVVSNTDLNNDILRGIEEKCYIKASMYGSTQHSQISDLKVVARLTKPAEDMALPDVQYPPQCSKDLGKYTDIEFISDLSKPFSLDSVGVDQHIELRSVETHQLMISGKKDRMIYSIGVLVRNGTGVFRRTKQVFFSPRIVIVNKLPLPMLLRQHCLEDLASLQTQSSHITGKSRRQRVDNTQSNMVNTTRPITLNLLESTPDNHPTEDDFVDIGDNNKRRDPGYLEAKYHAKAALIERTEQFVPVDQTETLHWSHSGEERLVSFKLLTHDDLLTDVIETEAVSVMAQSVKQIKKDVYPQGSKLISSVTGESLLKSVSVSDDNTFTQDQRHNKSLLLDNFDLRSIACPRGDPSAYTIQSDGHSVISAIPNTRGSVDRAAQEQAKKVLKSSANNGKKNKDIQQESPWDDGIWGWSGYFDPSQVGDQTIIVRNPISGKSLIVKVRIIMTAPDIRNTAGNTLTVIFEAQDLVFPKYRIENKTCSDTIRIAQAGSQEWLTLRPYDSTVYTWDQPLLKGILQVDIISGSSTIHQEYSLEQLGSKGTITVPGESSTALNLAVAPQNQVDENGVAKKVSKRQSKIDFLGEQALYHQQGGLNPISNDQSKRSTHTVFVYVRAEGPTRVLVISDFPSVNQDVDLLTSGLLNTAESKESIQGLYDQCRIGMRGADVGQLLQKWHQSKDLTAYNNPNPTDELGVGQVIGFTEREIPGPHGLRLLDQALVAKAQVYESQAYFDDFCTQVPVLHRGNRKSSYEASVQANLAGQQWGYQDFNQKDQLMSRVNELSQLYPGFDLWDNSLSENDISFLSQEKGSLGEIGLGGDKKGKKNVQNVSADNNSNGDISSMALTGADQLPLTAEELVDLVKVRAQTIKSIVIKHNNVAYQTTVVQALAKWQLLQNNPQLAAPEIPTSPTQPSKKASAMFATAQNPSGLPSPKAAAEPTRTQQPQDKITLSQDELSLIGNLKDDVAYLTVKVNEARWLTPASITGLSDCYAQITFNGQSYRTYVALDTTNPYWGSEMFFRLDGVLLKDLREFQAFYLDTIKSDPLAEEIEMPKSMFNDLSLRVAIFHQNALLTDTFLGGVILGSLDSIILSQFQHESYQLRKQMKNLSLNMLPTTETGDLEITKKQNNASNNDNDNDDNDNDDDSHTNSPVFMSKRWFKLHALRHNKLLYGQCQLSFGFITNELTKQNLLLYELEQDLLEHILLLTRITLKYRAQLQSIDVGVIDLNTLYLQPQLQIPINEAFVQAVKQKDLVQKQHKLLKKIKFKEKVPKNGYPTRVTMTPIGPIRYPVINLQTLYKKRPYLFRNIELYPNFDPNAPQHQNKSQKTQTPQPTLPKFLPITLPEVQLTSILKELSDAAIKVYDSLVEDQKEIQVCVSIEDIAIDPKHIYDCLLKEDKLLPDWTPTKVVALVQCNGHVSKIDLFDFILSQTNPMSAIQGNNYNNDVSKLSESQSQSQSRNIVSDKEKSPVELNTSEPSSGLKQALNKEAELSVSKVIDDLEYVDDEDYPTLLVKETGQWIETYGVKLDPYYGPTQGDITILPHIMNDDDDDDEGDKPVANTEPETSLAMSTSNIDSMSSLDMGILSRSRNVNLTLNKQTGKFELLTFNIPLSLIKSYVDPLNDNFKNSNTAHLSPHDIPALTMTVMCEVQQSKPISSNHSNVEPISASTTAISPLSASSPSTIVTSPTSTLSSMSKSTTKSTTKSTPDKEKNTSVFDSIGFFTPLKASVHLADIDVPLVDLQYIDIYNPDESIKTILDEKTGQLIEIDSLGRQKQHLIVESHYYFARRAQFYQGTDIFGDGSPVLTQNQEVIKLLDRFTQRVLKPPTPIANLTPAEIKAAKNVYNTKNPHVMAAYLYNEHLESQLSNYLFVQEEQDNFERLKQRQEILRQRAQETKNNNSTQKIPQNVDEIFWSKIPVSLSTPPQKHIFGIDSDAYPLLKRVPLSPVRATIKAHLQSSKPLIEKPTMSMLLSVPHFGLSLVDSTLGKAEELLYISTKCVTIEIEDSLTQRAIEFKVGNFQIDQCIEFDSNAIGGNDGEKESVGDASKIIFGPSESALASGQPFFHLSMTQTKTRPNYPVQVFKYATVLIQEMNIRVEEALIWHLLRFSNDIVPALSSAASSDPTAVLSQLVCDQRLLYIPANISSTALFYFNVLHIQPISLFLTFKINPDVRSAADDLTFNPIQTVLNAVTGVIGSIDAAPICMASLLISDASGDIATLIGPIVQFYVSQGIREVYKVLFSVEVLGNPVSLVSGVGSGVKDFFYEPAQGLVSSPKDFGTGLVKGSASLLRSVTTGLFGAASKVTGSVGKGLSTLTMDSSFQSSRRARNNRKIKHAGEGLLQGTKALSYGLFSGISGIVMNPLEGARTGGAKGFLVGVATGLTGVVTKTASGALDLISLSLQGLSNTFKLFDDDVEPTRARFPRFISSYGSMRDYHVKFALGRFVLDAVQPPKLDGTAKKIFSAITGLGHGRMNVQRENDFTMETILNFVNSSNFYDFDLSSTNLSATNLTSVLVELEALLLQTIYGAVFVTGLDNHKGNNNGHKNNPPNKQYKLTSKDISKLKDIHSAINARIKFLSNFISEDLVTCYVLNDSVQKHNPSANRNNNIDGMSPHATLVVLTTRRLIAVNIGDVVKCSKEGGALTNGVKCNILLDRLVDLSLVLAEKLPDKNTTKLRQRAQQVNSTKQFKGNKDGNKNGFLGIGGALRGVGGLFGGKNGPQQSQQSVLMKQQRTSMQRQAINYLIISHSNVGNDKANDRHISTIKIPIMDTLECQTTLLSLQSYLLRPKLLLVKFGDKDISKQFATQFYKIPVTPFTLLASNNATTEFCESITLGAPRVQNLHKSRKYPYTPQVLQENEVYYPQEGQINEFLSNFNYSKQIPHAVVTTNMMFDPNRPNIVCNTIRTFKPTTHGALPMNFFINNYLNNIKKENKKRTSLLQKSLFERHSQRLSGQSGNNSDKNSFTMTDDDINFSREFNNSHNVQHKDHQDVIFDPKNFTMVDTSALFFKSFEKSEHVIHVNRDQAQGSIDNISVQGNESIPTTLPLNQYPQTTLRTTPFALVLRKPSHFSNAEWNNKIFFGPQEESGKQIDENNHQNLQDLQQYRTKILSVTFTIGTHVVTREYTVFDESIVLL